MRGCELLDVARIGTERPRQQMICGVGAGEPADVTEPAVAQDYAAADRSPTRPQSLDRRAAATVALSRADRAVAAAGQHAAVETGP